MKLIFAELGLVRKRRVVVVTKVGKVMRIDKGGNQVSECYSFPNVFAVNMSVVLALTIKIADYDVMMTGSLPLELQVARNPVLPSLVMLQDRLSRMKRLLTRCLGVAAALSG